MYDNLILGIHTMSIWFGLKTGCDNIVVSRHVFGEAVFPIAASPRLTNDLGIFPWDDAPSVAPIPDPLPEACIPPGFPPLAVAGG
jgi:hypothetical protein